MASSAQPAAGVDVCLFGYGHFHVFVRSYSEEGLARAGDIVHHTGRSDSAGVPERTSPEIGHCAADCTGMDLDVAGPANALSDHTVAEPRNRHSHYDDHYDYVVEASAEVFSVGLRFLAMLLGRFYCHIDIVLVGEAAATAGDTHCVPCFSLARPSSSPLESAKRCALSYEQVFVGDRGCRFRTRDCGCLATGARPTNDWIFQGPQPFPAEEVSFCYQM